MSAIETAEMKLRAVAVYERAICQDSLFSRLEEQLRRFRAGEQTSAERVDLYHAIRQFILADPDREAGQFFVSLDVRGQQEIVAAAMLVIADQARRIEATNKAHTGRE